MVRGNDTYSIKVGKRLCHYFLIKTQMTTLPILKAIVVTLNESVGPAVNKVTK